jgi:hypothetical protein
MCYKISDVWSDTKEPQEMDLKEGARAFEGLRCNPAREVETDGNFFV